MTTIILFMVFIVSCYIFYKTEENKRMLKKRDFVIRNQYNYAFLVKEYLKEVNEISPEMHNIISKFVDYTLDNGRSNEYIENMAKQSHSVDEQKEERLKEEVYKLIETKNEHIYLCLVWYASTCMLIGIELKKVPLEKTEFDIENADKTIYSKIKNEEFCVL